MNDLSSIYKSRFSNTGLDKRKRVWKILCEDFFQRQVGENSVIYSVVSSVQAATEIAAIYPANVALLARVTEAWNWLLKGTLLARPVWELRARKVLPLI